MYGSGDDYNGYDDEVDAWDNDNYEDRYNGDGAVQPSGASINFRPTELLGLIAGWLKMSDMNLTDVKLTTQVSRYEIDEHEIAGQDILIIFIHQHNVVDNETKNI